MMNVMKNSIIACAYCILGLIVVSCDGVTNFLDKPPGVDLNEDIVFSSPTELQAYITGTYRVGIHSMLAMHNQSGNTGHQPNVNPTGTGYFQGSATFSDEGTAQASWGEHTHWNSGSTRIEQIPWVDNRYHRRWAAIRRANILLERVDEVPDLSQADVDQVKGEALFIRALNYYEMLKRYGGVPIVKTRLTAEELLESTYNRGTIEDVVNFIVEDIDEAVKLLPNEQPPNWVGRATKGAALMVKARTLLTAASPQFNTATPYLDFGEYNELIIYGNYAVSRWQNAADAAREVIDWANEGWARIIDEHGPEKNYKYVWETVDNDEVIFDNKFGGERGRWSYPWPGILPSQLLDGYGGPSMNFQFQQLYEKRDGTPQTWDMDGGNDLNQKYAELDPRFHQTVFHNGSYWNNGFPFIETFEGGAHGDWENGNYGGAWQRKFIPDNLTPTSSPIPNNIIFRLADAYLMYAEALNEAQGPVQEAHDAVNIIRNRSDMPDLPAGLSQDEFRERVRNERAIELAFEDSRFWDLKRWLIAEDDGYVNGNMWGLKIRDIGGGEYSYEPWIHQIRTFHKKMYLYPFLTDEVNKGYLVQNPGW